ncbi:MAG: ATP-binding protein [Candidatus Muirbacterium halophilum]|nr:ATP-binding protein [Candidatus Muirbacterium halophilum]
MQKEIIVMVGTPLSGKSTYVKNNYPHYKVISRDDIIMELSNSDNYNDAWLNVDQKLVDKIYNERLNTLLSNNENIVIDKTNMNVKSRSKLISIIPKDYCKIAVVMPILSDEEYEKRNTNRFITENKDISYNVFRSMTDSFEPPTKEEGFNYILNI